MFRLTIAVMASLFGLSQLAAAADLPTPYAPSAYPTKAPPPAYSPGFSWAGFYLGVNAGWGWSSGDGTIAFGGPSGTVSGSGNGFVGGIQGGYNWQMANFVFGVETDFQAGTGSGDLNATAGATTMTGELKTPWFGTIRGRVGYAMDRWLFYVTGGAAYGQAELDGTLSTTGSFSSSATYWTWTAGAGIETALWDRWTTKLEYLYVGSPNEFPVPPGTTALDGDLHAHLLRLGLNYRF